jgi:ABC-type phosphate transport system substrate-binding protein
VDPSATAIDESAAAQPSVPKSFLVGALTGQVLGSSASKKGWNLLIPASVDSNINNKRINICRRTPGSGTQAASNLYFANNPCGGTANQYTPVAGTTGATPSVLGSLTVQQGSSTQLVENCLGATDALADSTGGGYAFGVLGRENNPQAVVNGVPSEKGYRYVKLSGATPSRAALISGEYDFAVESSMQWAKSGAANAPSADVLALLTKMRGEMGKASVLQGLDVDLQNGLAALPSTFSGAWSDLDPVTKSYTSHTNRISANSCSPVRMTK